MQFLLSLAVSFVFLSQIYHCPLGFASFEELKFPLLETQISRLRDTLSIWADRINKEAAKPLESFKVVFPEFKTDSLAVNALGNWSIEGESHRTPWGSPVVLVRKSTYLGPTKSNTYQFQEALTLETDTWLMLQHFAQNPNKSLWGDCLNGNHPESTPNAELRCALYEAVRKSSSLENLKMGLQSKANEKGRITIENTDQIEVPFFGVITGATITLDQRAVTFAFSYRVIESELWEQDQTTSARSFIESNSENIPSSKLYLLIANVHEQFLDLLND